MSLQTSCVGNCISLLAMMTSIYSNPNLIFSRYILCWCEQVVIDSNILAFNPPASVIYIHNFCKRKGPSPPASSVVKPKTFHMFHVSQLCSFRHARDSLSLRTQQFAQASIEILLMICRIIHGHWLLTVRIHQQNIMFFLGNCLQCAINDEYVELFCC